MCKNCFSNFVLLTQNAPIVATHHHSPAISQKKKIDLTACFLFLQNLGEAEHSFLETPKMVAKVLYDNTNHIHYVLPTIKQHDMIAIMSKVDYIL